jgi:hypothetical protein
MAPPRLEATVIAIAILAGCGGAPVAATEPAVAEPSCEGALDRWVHTRFGLVVEASGEVGADGEAAMSDLVALMRARRDVASVRVEAQRLCAETSVAEMQSAAQRVARRLMAAGVPAASIEVIATPGDGVCPQCPCAPSSAKGRAKCSARCRPEHAERAGAVRVELSLRVVECE